MGFRTGMRWVGKAEKVPKDQLLEALGILGNQAPRTGQRPEVAAAVMWVCDDVGTKLALRTKRMQGRRDREELG